MSTLAEAAQEFVEVFARSDTCADIGPSLTCSEANALADLLRAGGEVGAAETLIEAHAEEDDIDDEHFVGEVDPE